MTGAIDVVSDANVALKWFHAEDEEEAGPSRVLLDMHRDRSLALHMLDLTPYEVGNALLRGRGVPPDRIATVLAALGGIVPRIAPLDADFRDAVTLADQHRLTLYDATYAAVARRRGAHLATFGRALLRAGLGQRPSELVAALSSR